MHERGEFEGNRFRENTLTTVVCPQLLSMQALRKSGLTTGACSLRRLFLASQDATSERYFLLK